MSSSYVSRQDAMSTGALVALLALLITFATGRSSRDGLRQDPKPQEQQAAAPRHVGDAPMPLAESRTVVLQTTPEELVASVIAARARRDLAALARCSSTTVDRPALDQIDAARAERDFVDGEVLWTRLEAAVKAKTLRTLLVEKPERSEDGFAFEASGTLVFPSGSRSIDEFSVAIVRHRGAWFVKVSP